MPSRIVWTTPAFADLKAAHDFIRRRDPQAARKFAANVRTSVALLRDHPELGRVHEELPPIGMYRALVVAPYLVVYRLDAEETVVILRLWDGRQSPDALKI